MEKKKVETANVPQHRFNPKKLYIGSTSIPHRTAMANMSGEKRVKKPKEE